MMLFIALALLLLAALGYLQHHVAVAVLAALLPAYLLRFTVAGLPTNVLEASVVVVFLAGALSSQVRQGWAKSFRRLPKPVSVWALLFLAAVLMSAVISPHLRTSMGIVKGWVVVPMALGWLVFAASDNAAARRAVQRALFASAALMAAIGLSQIGSLSRVQSLYDVPNSLALFLVPLTVLAWWQGRHTTAALLAAATLATQSAAAAASLVLTLAVGAACWPKQAGRKFVGALFVLVVIAGFYFASSGRLAYLLTTTGGEHNSVSVRRQLWSISFDLIRENPILGIGLGVFEPAYQQKLHERFVSYESSSRQNESVGNKPLREFVFRDPHNWILSLWLNTGLLGLLSFIGLYGWAIWYAAGPGQRPSRPTQALVLGLVSLLMFGFVDTIYWKNDLAALHWLLFALLLNQVRTDRIQNGVGQKRQSNTNESRANPYLSRAHAVGAATRGHIVVPADNNTDNACHDHQHRQ